MALILISLAGDVELNPGFRRLADVKNTRSLKIAHLNVQSLWNKIDLLRLEQFDNKTIDVLTLWDMARCEHSGFRNLHPRIYINSSEIIQVALSSYAKSEFK